MSRELRKLLATVTGVVISIFSILVLCSCIGMFISPKISFKNSPEFIQDETGILDVNSKEWLKTQIRSRANETSVAIVLDLQRSQFDITKEYLDTVISREVETNYNSQRYLVITYFDDIKEAVISTNIDQNGINAYKIENIKDSEDLLKEVSYLTLKLNDKMKPMKTDLTKVARKQLILPFVAGIICLLLGINISTVNMGGKRRKKEVREIRETEKQE